MNILYFLCHLAEIAMLAYITRKVVKIMKVRIESASLDALLDVAAAAKAHADVAEQADVADKASLDAAKQSLAELQAKLDTANTVLANESDLSTDQQAKLDSLVAPAPTPAPAVTPPSDVGGATAGPAVVPAS